MGDSQENVSEKENQPDHVGPNCGVLVGYIEELGLYLGTFRSF